MRLALSLACVVALLCAVTPAAQGASTITYKQVGGISGLNEKLTINSKRVATHTGHAGRARKTLSEARYDRIVRIVRQAKLATSRRYYKPKRPIADHFTYTLSFGGHTVRADDGIDMPHRLEVAFAEMAGLRVELLR